MRRRELIVTLRGYSRQLRNTQIAFCGNAVTTQQNAEKRMTIFHGIERLLPEIIEKMEQQP